MTQRDTLYSLDVILRILKALTDGGLRRTRIALKTNMNYTSCQKYLQLLEAMGWLRQESISESDHILSISPLGKQMENRLSLFLDQPYVAENEVKSLVEPPMKITEGANSDQVGSQAGKEPTKIDVAASCEPAKKINNIMLIDDERDIVLTYKSILSHAGYHVDGFSRPELALKRLAMASRSHYDLLIIDIRMPGINGIELYQRVKAITPATKIIFISSLDAAAELASILPDITDNDVLKKPVDKTSLIRKVTETVSRH